MEFSYIRNSVKVVVDAYEGDVRFYVIDPADPVLRAYRAAFPSLFRSLDEMSPGLRQHLRYPRDLFEVQVDKFNTYHMTVPQVFYNREDVWAPPKEKFGGEAIQMEPYYVLMKLPGEDRLQFLLMTPVTPRNRDNMIAWIAARSDFPGYGEMIVYKLSKDQPHPWAAPDRSDDRSGHDDRAPAHTMGPTRFSRDPWQSSRHPDRPVLSLRRTGVSASRRDEHSAAQAGHRQRRQPPSDGIDARGGPPSRIRRATVNPGGDGSTSASAHVGATRGAVEGRGSAPARRLDRIWA